MSVEKDKVDHLKKETKFKAKNTNCCYNCGNVIDELWDGDLYCKAMMKKLSVLEYYCEVPILGICNLYVKET